MTPFRTALLFLFLATIGFTLGLFLQVDFLPTTSDQSFVVAFTSDQNDPPMVVEQKITSILEGVLSGVTDLRKIESVSKFGRGNITLIFNDADMQSKRLEILTAIRQVQNQLPKNMPFPTIELGKGKDTKQPILIYSLTSSLPVNEIEEYTRQHLLPKMGLNPGIKTLELSTDSRTVIEFSYDDLKLNAAGLDIRQIKSSIEASFFRDQIGTISSNNQTKSLTVNTQPDDITSMMEMHISDQIVLGNVMKVRMGNRRPTYIARLNGQNAVLIRLFAHDHENKASLARRLREEISILQQKLPKYLELKLSYDDTTFITNELNKVVKRVVLSIGILSLLILLVHRRFRQLIILIGSVIVSLGLCSLFMYLLQVPVHLYSIAGLTISFGLVIDNAIMVMDHWRKKKDFKIVPALLSATSTTIAALAVILILPEKERVGMSDFALTISIALVSSILVSTFFTSALFNLLAKHSTAHGLNRNSLRFKVAVRSSYERSILYLARFKKWLIFLLILGFGFPVYLIPKTIDNFTLYNQTIGSVFYQENIRPVSDPILGGTLRSFYLNVFENSGFRQAEKTRLYITASMGEGHTIEQMDGIIKNVEKFLDKVQGLDSYRTTVYSGKYAEVVIEFTDEVESGSLPHVLRRQLIQRSLDWGGVVWDVYGVGKGFSNHNGKSLPSFRVKLKGYNYDALSSLADSIANQLLSHPRINHVNTNDQLMWSDALAEQYILVPKRRIDTETYLSSIEKTKDLTVSQFPENEMTVGKLRFPVVFKEATSQNYGFYKLLNEGDPIRFSSNAEIKRELKTSTLYRESRQYVRVLSFEYHGGLLFGNEFLNKVLGEVVLPVGYSYEVMENEWGTDQASRSYSLILLILVLIYVICSVTFESWSLPFYILFIIPLSFIGIFMTFSLGGFYFDQGGYVAFVLLAGIVVNATIFILHEVKNYKSYHWNRKLIKACTTKFVPILLTILSTCLGLVPFLIDGPSEVFWFSFATGVIGGLSFSVLLVFVVFPILLARIDKGKN